MAHSERLGKRESTKEAVKYAVQQNKAEILKMWQSIDRNLGKISKDDFLRILRTFGVFPNTQAVKAVTDGAKEEKVFYQDFVRMYE